MSAGGYQVLGKHLHAHPASSPSKKKTQNKTNALYTAIGIFCLFYV
jgi:hypothetical protein